MSEKIISENSTKLKGEKNWRNQFKDEKKELEEHNKHLEKLEKFLCLKIRTCNVHWNAAKRQAR